MLAIELFGATFISWYFVSSPWFRRFHHTPISVLPHMPFFPLNTYTPVITKKTCQYDIIYSVKCGIILSHSPESSAMPLGLNDLSLLQLHKVNHIQQFQHFDIPYCFHTVIKTLNNWTVCYIVDLSPLSKCKKNLVFIFYSQKRKRGCVFALFYCLLSGGGNFGILL